MKFWISRQVARLRQASVARQVAACVWAMLVTGLAMMLTAAGNYRLLNTYKFAPAPGSAGEYFDYITVDAAARRVYLSRGTAVQVLDADSGASIGFVQGAGGAPFKRQHGVALAPEFNRGFISDGGAAKIYIFDLKTLQPVGEAMSDADTDCVVYDPASKRVFSMNGDSHSSTVVDAKTGAVLKTIALPGAPEFAVADGKGMVYANISDKNEISVIDTKTLEVKANWPVAPSGGSTALAMDVAHRRLFTAGRGPQTLAILNADTGKVIQSFPISGGADAAAFDPATGLIFVSTREGYIHVFHEDSPDKFSAVESVKTQVGAKTMGLDAKTHHLFLDTVDFAAPAAPATPVAPAGGGARAGARGGQPAAVPGSFHVLVYGQ